MDVAYPLMVVGTAERHLQIFNLTQPTVPFKTLISPLRWQTRVVRQNFAPLLRGWTKWLNSLRTRRSLAFRTRRDTPSEPSKVVSQSSGSLTPCLAVRLWEYSSSHCLHRYVDDKAAATGNFTFKCVKRRSFPDRDLRNAPPQVPPQGHARDKDTGGLCRQRNQLPPLWNLLNSRSVPRGAPPYSDGLLTLGSSTCRCRWNDQLLGQGEQDTLKEWASPPSTKISAELG